MAAFSPDCRDGNHQKCDGLALDEDTDEITWCWCRECDCYPRNWDDPYTNLIGGGP
jgi:hypothetical protein